VNPTADDVARAIVAAAHETGEDPIECAERKMGMRCRHYAMHALAHVFPDMKRQSLGSVVGCPGKGARFWSNSMMHVVAPAPGLRPGQGYRPHVAKWWDDEAFGRVIAAIERSLATVHTVPIEPSKPWEPLREDELAGLPEELRAELIEREERAAPAIVSAPSKPPNSIDRRVDRLRAKLPSVSALTTSFGPLPKAQINDSPPLVNPRRSELNAMLAEAVRNTARMGKGIKD
jgi:hypothetical protein